jgi:SAM-dependent methyltransferase
MRDGMEGAVNDADRAARAGEQRKREGGDALLKQLFAGVGDIGAAIRASRQEDNRTAADELARTCALKNVYGEVESSSLQDLLGHCHISIPLGNESDGGGGIGFVDLGCGAGRAVFTAAINGYGDGNSFTRAVGVEQFQSLHQQSLRALSVYESEGFVHSATALYGCDACATTAVSFVRADFTNLCTYDWVTGPNVVLANLADSSLIRTVAELAKNMLPGSIMVTVFQPLPSAFFELVHSGQYQMSWGQARCYVQRRTQQCKEAPEWLVKDAWVRQRALVAEKLSGCIDLYGCAAVQAVCECSSIAGLWAPPPPTSGGGAGGEAATAAGGGGGGSAPATSTARSSTAALGMQPRRLLRVGDLLCGPGTMLWWLCQHVQAGPVAIEAAGVDLSPHMIEFARANWLAQQPPPPACLDYAVCDMFVDAAVQSELADWDLLLLLSLETVCGHSPEWLPRLFRGVAALLRPGTGVGLLGWCVEQDDALRDQVERSVRVVLAATPGLELCHLARGSEHPASDPQSVCCDGPLRYLAVRTPSAGVSLRSNGRAPGGLAHAGEPGDEGASKAQPWLTGRKLQFSDRVRLATRRTRAARGERRFCPPFSSHSSETRTDDGRTVPFLEVDEAFCLAVRAVHSYVCPATDCTVYEHEGTRKQERRFVL